MKIGKVEIKNRYFMAPMGGVGQAGSQCEFSKEAADYYAARARGGVGCIFTGVAFTDTKVDPVTPGKNVNPNYAPEKFLETATPMCERVHTSGAKIFMQLSVGPGRNGAITAPSEIPFFWNPGVKCRALTAEEIKLKVQQEAAAAQIAQRAGFDGVEIHAMHEGYLLDQFAMSYMNHRTDEYGGSLENRLRFAVEACQAIKAACGQNFPVGMRLGLKTYIKGFNQASLDGSGEVGRTLEEGIEIAKHLAANGFDVLSVDSGTYDSFYYVHPPMYQPKGLNLDLAKKCHEAVNIPVIVAGRLDEPELGEQALQDDAADGIVIGRALLADPEFCNKALTGQEEDIRPCLSCHMGCMGRIFAGKPMCCAVNPTVLREESFALTPALTRKKVLIVGAGVGGMEAARVSAIRGHEVELCERSGQVGGKLEAAAAPSFKEDDQRLVEWYERQIKRLGVRLRLNTEVTPEMIRESDADVVIIGNGADPIIPRIPGAEKPNCITSIDALLGLKEVGQKVVVVGGGLVGCETALKLMKDDGKEVVIVEALPKLMSSGIPTPVPNAQMLVDLIADSKIVCYTGSPITEVTDRGCIIDHDGGKLEIVADTVCMAVGFRPDRSLYLAVQGCGKEVYEIGDGKQTANILTAVWDAYEIARMI